MLTVMVLLLIAFVLRVFRLIEMTGYEPSTLITAVFAAALGEFGVLGWIKTTKTRHGDNCDLNNPYNNTDDLINNDNNEGVG